MYERIQWLVQEFGEIYMNAGEQGAVKVRALSEIGHFSFKQLEMLQLVGAIPKNLGSLKVEIDARALIGNIVDVFKTEGIGIDVQKKIMALVNPGESLQMIKEGGDDVDD